MSTRELELPALEKMAAEQGPRWPSRKAAWLDGYREGAQHARMTGPHVDAIREQLYRELGEVLLGLEAVGAAADAITIEQRAGKFSLGIAHVALKAAWDSATGQPNGDEDA